MLTLPAGKAAGRPPGAAGVPHRPPPPPRRRRQPQARLPRRCDDRERDRHGPGRLPPFLLGGGGNRPPAAAAQPRHLAAPRDAGQRPGPRRGAAGGRPLLFVTGHFGNWELGGYTLGLLGFSTFAIARKLDNPYLNDFLLHRFRQRIGQRILYKDGDFERIQAALAASGVIATLGDQDAGQRGQFVDFFGRPASTHKAVALLALEFNAVMVVIGVPRIGEPMRYEVAVEDVILPEEYAGRPDAVRAITQRFTAALERMVRRAPEQYFWLHRRWKHEPPVRKGKLAKCA